MLIYSIIALCFINDKPYKSMKKEITSKLPPIFVAQGEKLRLRKIMRASHVTVREALRGSISTPLALRIRKAAIENGGVASTK